MNERGFFLPALPMMAWGAIAAGVVIVGLGIGLRIQTARLETAKAETVATQGRFDAFVAQAKALGDAQNARTAELDAANKTLKEKTDAQLSKSKSDLAGVYAAYRKLRDSRASAGGGEMPAAARVTSSTDRTCFSTTGFAHAMGVLEAGVPGITEQGDVARLRLSTAAEWAASVNQKFSP